MLVGTGTCINFHQDFLAEVLSIDGPNLARESIETSHLCTTGAKTFMPGTLYDPGELTIEMAYNPATPPPIDEPPEEFTITFPGGTVMTGTGFMTGFEPSIPLEDKMTASVTLKLTGSILIGASSI